MSERSEVPSDMMTTDTLARSVLESAPDGMLLCDHDGIIVYANLPMVHMTGIDRDQLVGTTVEALVPEDARTNHHVVRQRYTNAPAARPMGAQLPLRMRRADGGELPVEISLSPVDFDGNAFVVATVRDVTERRAIERRLAESERLFRSTFESAPVGVILVELSPTGARTLRAANASFARLLHTTPDRIVGADMRDYAHPDDADADAAAAASMVSGSVESVRLEKRYRRTDGSYIWAELHANVLLAGDPGPIMTLAHVLDISERRERERADARDHVSQGVIAELARSLVDHEVRQHSFDLIVCGACEVIGATVGMVIQRLDSATGTNAIVGSFGEVGTEWWQLRVDALDPALFGCDRPTGLVPADELGAADVFRDHQLIGVTLGHHGGSGTLLLVAEPVESLDSDELEALDEFARRASLTLAAAAGRLAQEQVRMLDERERIARDLHDTVIQDLFAAGMRISAGLPLLSDPGVALRYSEVIDQIDATIRKVRSVVFDLHQRSLGTRALTDEIAATVSEVARALGFQPHLELIGPIDELPDVIAEHVVPVLRESLSNVSRHAEASMTAVRIRWSEGHLTIQVDDNGRGIDPNAPPGSGTVNLRERAELLGGELTIGPRIVGGTSVTWKVPAQVT